MVAWDGCGVECEPPQVAISEWCRGLVWLPQEPLGQVPLPWIGVGLYWMGRIGVAQGDGLHVFVGSAAPKGRRIGARSDRRAHSDARQFQSAHRGRRRNRLVGEDPIRGSWLPLVRPLIHG